MKTPPFAGEAISTSPSVERLMFTVRPGQGQRLFAMARRSGNEGHPGFGALSEPPQLVSYLVLPPFYRVEHVPFLTVTVPVVAEQRRRYRVVC